MKRILLLLWISGLVVVAERPTVRAADAAPDRSEIAQYLITRPFHRPELHATEAEVFDAIARHAPHGLEIPFPQALRPEPKPLSPLPAPSDRLPRADVVVITYTQAEAAALADVLTPGIGSSDWYPYARNYETKYRPLVGQRGPSRQNGRLGSYFLTTVAGKTVLVMKSELHMSTDKKRLNGEYSLPIRDLYKQIITESRPAHVLTTGTSGGVSCRMHLGDVVVTRGAMFHCRREFNYLDGKSFKSEWTVPTTLRATAQKLAQAFANRLSGSGAPPDPHCHCPDTAPGFPTQIFFDGEGDMKEYFPILTRDFFEFGTDTNHLEKLGVACEMDDAVLGLACEDLRKAGQAAPLWVSVRNLSDPTINGALDEGKQVRCAVFYYRTYGYWTSVVSALAVWSIVAGL